MTDARFVLLITPTPRHLQCFQKISKVYFLFFLTEYMIWHTTVKKMFKSSPKQPALACFLSTFLVRLYVSYVASSLALPVTMQWQKLTQLKNSEPWRRLGFWGFLFFYLFDCLFCQSCLFFLSVSRKELSSTFLGKDRWRCWSSQNNTETTAWHSVKFCGLIWIPFYLLNSMIKPCTFHHGSHRELVEQVLPMQRL